MKVNRWWWLRRLVLVVLMMVMAAGCSRYIESRNPLHSLPQGGVVPENVRAYIENGAVTLRWEVADTANVERFRVYVSDSATTGFSLLDSTVENSITLEGLTVNKRYYFRVAAVLSTGLEWEPSETVSARVLYLSMMIQNDEEYTNSRYVQVRINTSSEATYLRLSEDSTFADAEFVPYDSPQRSFTLSEGDGVKVVYAQVQFADGAMTGEVLSDDIILDTHVRIDSVYFMPTGTTFAPGDTVTFGMVTGETGGEASVGFTGVGGIPLYDDGTNGDQVAEDGTYTGIWVVPAGFTLLDGSVGGSFTDAAGNRATPVSSLQLLNVNTPPEPVELLIIADTSDTVEFYWTESNDDNFASYRLYRDVSSEVSTSDELVAVETSRGTLHLTHILPDVGIRYYFRLFVYDEHGAFAGSNVVKVH